MDGLFLSTYPSQDIKENIMQLVYLNFIFVNPVPRTNETLTWLCLFNLGFLQRTI